MTKIVDQLNGFTLQEFLTTQLYSPAEKAAVKKSNADYYSEKERIRVAKFRQEQEANKPKQLSEQQRFEIQVAAHNKQLADQKAREDFQAGLVKQHEDYLNSDIQRAAICCNSLASFIREYSHWLLRGYSLELETLDAQLPSLFVCYMLAPQPLAKSKK